MAKYTCSFLAFILCLHCNSLTLSKRSFFLEILFWDRFLFLLKICPPVSFSCSLRRGVLYILSLWAPLFWSFLCLQHDSPILELSLFISLTSKSLLSPLISGESVIKLSILPSLLNKLFLCPKFCHHFDHLITTLYLWLTLLYVIIDLVAESYKFFSLKYFSFLLFSMYFYCLNPHFISH